MTTEQMIVAALYAIYLNAVVGRLAYVLGKDRGAKEEREFRKHLPKVDTIWRVDDDGYLHKVEGGEE